MNARLPVGAFSIGAEFGAGRVAVSVRGELDSTTAPELGAVIGAVIDSSRSVILDLAECDFIDAAGLRAIAEGATRAQMWGGELSIRSPSGVVRRLLDIIGLDLASVARLGIAPVAARPLAWIEAVSDPDPSAPAAPVEPIYAGVTRHHLVDTALSLLVALARESVGGADGVSVSLRRHGQLATVAGSDQTVLDMDAHQYATGEGPCVDASAEGRRVLTTSLGSETRWPVFTPRAQALGINAILSSPLMSAGSPAGALNIYSRLAGAFDGEDERRASVFAAEGSIVLDKAARETTEDPSVSRLGAALRSRQVIALAQGVMMERDRVAEQDAYTALRRFSSGTGRPLRERAEDVVASTQWPVPGGAAQSPGGRT